MSNDQTMIQNPPRAVAPEEGWKPFTSRKLVDCAVIRAAEFEADGSGRVATRNENGGTDITNVPAGFSRKSGSIRAGDIIVRYSDGYLSWLPRAKFEEPGAYTLRGSEPAPDYRDRVRAERADLADKLGKLRAFLFKGKPDTLSEDEFRRMQRQRACMAAYLDVLDERIEAFA